MVTAARARNRNMNLPRGNAAPLRDDPYIPEYGKQHLLNPTDFDSILRSEGYTGYQDHIALLDTYDSLARDCHLSAVLQSRIADVVRRELIVTPYDTEDGRAILQAEFIKEILENLGTLADDSEAGEALVTTGSQGFDAVVENMMFTALLTGFSVGEIMWGPGFSNVLGTDITAMPIEIRMRKPRRFGFKLGKNGYIPRLITRTNQSHGEPIRPRKFIFHHNNIMAGPYGLGLGHNLYWPVQIKRENVTFWGVFNEKFGSPTALWKYPLDSSEDERISVEQAMMNIQQDAVIGIPETFTAELLEAMRSGSISTYQELNQWCDDQISECILGQTGTTNQSGGGGSRARDEVAERVSFRIAKRDADMIGRTLQQTLVKWTIYTTFGFNNARLPKIEWAFPELEERVDLAEASQVDERITNMTGVKLDREYIETKYEVVFDEGDAERADTRAAVEQDMEGDVAQAEADAVITASQNSGDTPELAEVDPLNRPIQDVADDIASQAVERSLDTLERWDAQLTALLDDSRDYADFQSRLFTLFEELDDSSFTQLLSQGLAVSQGVGVLEASETPA